MNRKNCQLLSLALCGCDRVCDTTGIEILLEFLEIVFLGGCKILLQLFWQDFEISIEFLDSSILGKALVTALGTGLVGPITFFSGTKSFLLRAMYSHGR